MKRQRLCLPVHLSALAALGCFYGILLNHVVPCCGLDGLTLPQLQLQLPSQLSVTTDSTSQSQTTTTSTASSSTTSATVSHVVEIEPRIVGGSEAAAGEFPWFVASTGDYYCGASLIHDDIVLTAAHCLVAFPKGAGVYVGAMVRGTDQDGAVYRTITETKRHPQFNDETISYDFLLLKLDQAVPSTTITPIQLNNNTKIPVAGDSVTNMGFGRTADDGDVSPILLQVDMIVVDDQTCASEYANVGSPDGALFQFQPAVMMCANANGKASCQGDSGGPLIMTGTNLQVGIVSFGVGCAQQDFAGVYSEVSGAYDWIQQGICMMSETPPASCKIDLPGVTVAPVQPTFELSIVFDYDSRPDQTTWDLAPSSSSSSSSKAIASGPKQQPKPNAVETTPVPNVPAGSYTFTVHDSAGDGLKKGAGFQIYLVDGSPSPVLLASSDSQSSFTKQMSVTFTVPDANYASRCRDSSGLAIVLTSSELKSCAWLAANLHVPGQLSYAFLCGYQDVATACPVTCGTCATVQAVQQSATTACQDQTGSIPMMTDQYDTTDQQGATTTTYSSSSSGSGSSSSSVKDCSWLASNLDQYKDLCTLTTVAFHCPATCKTGICSK